MLNFVMKRSYLFWVVLAVLLLPSRARAESIDELVRRADMAYRGKTSAAVMKMAVKTKSYQRKFKMVAWDDSRKGKDRTLIKILGPAAWRGNGTLKIGEQLKLYDPKTNHVQVVGSSMLGGPWMGSHFSNDDLVKETRLARDYNLTLDKKWTAAAPVGNSATFYRVTMTPKPTAPVAWGKIVYVLWENDKAVVPKSATYYRKASDEKPARTIKFSRLKKMAGRWIPSKMTVRVTSKPGEYTTITYKKLRLDIEIPDKKFTEQALRH